MFQEGRVGVGVNAGQNQGSLIMFWSSAECVVINIKDCFDPFHMAEPEDFWLQCKWLMRRKYHNYEDIGSALTVGLHCGPTGNAEEIVRLFWRGGGQLSQMLLHSKAEWGTQICKWARFLSLAGSLLENAVWVSKRGRYSEKCICQTAGRHHFLTLLYR